MLEPEEWLDSNPDRVDPVLYSPTEESAPPKPTPDEEEEDDKDDDAEDKPEEPQEPPFDVKPTNDEEIDKFDQAARAQFEQQLKEEQKKRGVWGQEITPGSPDAEAAVREAIKGQ